jgi:hypothetical protein
MPGTTGRYQMLSDLEAELRGLLEAIRFSLEDLSAASGQETLNRFFDMAPVEACVRLADIWAIAEGIGLMPETLKSRFTAEEQFLLEIVTSIYSAGRGQRHVGASDEIAELFDLLGETAA